MPCHEPDESGVLQQKLDERTAMLCEAMKELDRIRFYTGAALQVSLELSEWWQQHQRWDAERREQGR